MNKKTTARTAGTSLRSAERGFSLIELMITVTIVGVLVAVALPKYEQYVQRTHRSKAKSALQQTAQWMERAATAQGIYPPAAAVAPGVLIVEGNRYATVTVVVSANGANFTATAAPLGTQLNDPCKSFTYTQSGARGISGTTITASECWER